MLELRLPQGGLLKKVLEAMRELVTDANFDCSRSGISLQAMDSTHVALVALLLSADSFDHFRCDRSRSIGMNLNCLAKILRCAANDDVLTLKADDDSDTVVFIFENPIVISVTKEGVKFSTTGDIGSANIVCRQNTTVDKPEESMIIEMNDPVSLAFALRYLNAFTKATPLSNSVKICMSSDLPVVVEYKIAEMGYIRYYLAPKIEDDDQT
ncbi:proliferating cell nuclear antigen-like isoform X2 [Zingiber officinale]|uniref:proliferating cell nuclear antigen-like isoform X2 n=1 Tax=Zingiber officinale TaxID=94328 RepID=UPI001C4BE0F4|nr:proliferating cell nuclear antigen-like isoform X2 [Zingiber officinale]